MSALCGSDLWRIQDWSIEGHWRELRAAWQRLDAVADDLPNDGAGEVAREVSSFLGILDQEVGFVVRLGRGLLVPILPGLATQVMQAQRDETEDFQRLVLTAVANRAIESFLGMGEDEFADEARDGLEAYREMLKDKKLNPDRKVADGERLGLRDAQADRLRTVLRDVKSTVIDGLVGRLSECVSRPDLREAATPIVRAVMDERATFFDRFPKVEGECPTVESVSAKLTAAS